jgi:hypothetical protein
MVGEYLTAEAHDDARSIGTHLNRAPHGFGRDGIAVAVEAYQARAAHRMLALVEPVEGRGDRLEHAALNRDACKACSLRPRCTQSFRRVSRLENEAVLDRMAARLALRPDVLDQRRNSFEHAFGTITQWMGQGTFLMRRLENVRGEFSLTALAYNIRRAITLVGVPGLIAAARA